MLLASSFLGFSAQRPAAAGSWVPVSNISRVDGVLAGVTAISADLALVAGASNGGPRRLDRLRDDVQHAVELLRRLQVRAGGDRVSVF